MGKIGIKDGLILGAVLGIMATGVTWTWVSTLVTTITDGVAKLVGTSIVDTVNGLGTGAFKYVVMGIIGAVIGAIVDAT